MGTLLLTQEQVKELVTMPEVLDAVEKTFRGMGEGNVVNPTKVHLDLGDGPSGLPYRAGMNSMPAYVGWQESAGIKFIGGWEGNPGKGLPYISGMILLVDPRDGRFLASMDGELVTALRTGAQSAVALKYLIANRQKPVIGLYGAGAQGRTQVAAIAATLDVGEFRVYDIRPEAAERFADEMSSQAGFPVRKVSSPEEAAEGADALVSVTHARNKFITNEMVKSGMTVCPLGSFRECADELILSVDKIIVDHVGQTLHRGALKEVVESGRLGEEDLYATIGEVVAGKKKGRENGEERILCIPIGTGAMDIAVATAAYRKALEQGVGVDFDFVRHQG
jgi:ornithine cyclodeaminase/alanine dehydrogenase